MKRASPTSNKLTWKWTRGALTELGDFGNPLGDTAYALCVYDERRGGPTLVARVAANPGEGWTPKSTKGFQKKDGLTDGVRKLSLLSGVDGKAKIVLTAKGPAAPVAALPVTLPLTVQLRSSHDGCWGARYSTTRRSDAGLLTAKSD
jgi:hypothetical protein